jgi:hypothetical protein
MKIKTDLDSAGNGLIAKNQLHKDKRKNKSAP